jgi:hypothetical protein
MPVVAEGRIGSAPDGNKIVAVVEHVNINYADQLASALDSCR